MGKRCRDKVKFKTLLSAKEFADRYMDNIALTFNPMHPFYCSKHRCYHIGHNKYSGAVDKTSEPM